MRKTWIAAFLLAGGVFAPVSSHATAPSLVEPVYDAATKVLSVKIRHWSLSDGLHYIKTVEVKVNGAVVSTTPYERQPATEYTYTYPLTANPGDVIDVTAKCNLWGARTVGLTIPPAASGAGAVPPSKPEEPAKADK